MDVDDATCDHVRTLDWRKTESDPYQYLTCYRFVLELFQNCLTLLDPASILVFLLKTSQFSTGFNTGFVCVTVCRDVQEQIGHKYSRTHKSSNVLRRDAMGPAT